MEATFSDFQSSWVEAIKPERTESNGASEAHFALPSPPIHELQTTVSEPTIPLEKPTVHFAGPEPRQAKLEAFSKNGRPSGSDRKASISFLNKLKPFPGFGNNSLLKSPSGWTVGADTTDDRSEYMSPDFEASTPRHPDTPLTSRTLRYENADAAADADEEQSEDEGSRLRIPRAFRTRQHLSNDSSPNTPRTPNLQRSYPQSPSAQGNGLFTRRQLRHSRSVTETDLPSVAQGSDLVSTPPETSRDARRPRRQHPLRGLSYSGGRAKSSTELDMAARPSPFRRALSSFSPNPQDGDPDRPSAWKVRSDRAVELSSARWQQLKAGLRGMGRTKKPKLTVDQTKSAELVSQMTAGAPAALILASMFQSDERGHKRIPVLLEQLKVNLTDVWQTDLKSGDRNLAFRIELEYGSGQTRMKWTIERTLRDFWNLHARYKFVGSAQKYIPVGTGKNNDSKTRMPHFPKNARPLLRGARDDGQNSDNDFDQTAEDTAIAPDLETADETDLPDGRDTDHATDSNAEGLRTPRPTTKRQITSPINLFSRRGTAMRSNTAGSGNALGAATGAVKREAWLERLRRELETYIRSMIRYFIFRPESNRLCKFLELSALGVRLASEGSYHGKEGTLVLRSAKGIDYRRAWKPHLIRQRHGPKWFMVRHSYVACVDSLEQMNIYDVFLFDQDFRLQIKDKDSTPFRDQSAVDIARAAKNNAHRQHHTLKLFNSERQVKMLAGNERQLRQFEASIREAANQSLWARAHRFDSFAPVRTNCFAQWLVDGRDYMWNVSRALNMAKDVIYIHDWWLSPELYMRRPPAISKQWRLDRILQRKAQQGVKIFVIMYKNINSAIPIDSEYTKVSLLELHPNVFVQRSPNQIKQNTFFWAHHEKICVVDNVIGFVGGIDLCFGRWDTPQHSLVDDKLTGFEDVSGPKDADHCQIFPGKDYSNPRVQDFYSLDKPYEEMYDRDRIPRMPWHDIGMQIVGQPARDLVRHFVQRWNYLQRERKSTRPMPFLLPPPDFDKAELEELGLEGTCEVQILRSCCMWSIGTPDRVEHSILNAYTKMIDQSEHFVYIENQFFISSTEVEGNIIENGIGEALVNRIIRASENGEAWKAIIVIPLMPGFQNTVDAPDGTSVRLIMQCQFRSICRGDQSIFGRLRASGIEPTDYIQFYSLRSWGKIGPRKVLTTEQLYIHAKIMVVDDRIAIIGSANINERSMLGKRDSECAAVVRDTEMIWSHMNGEPYMVGRFPHTLRMRLMREHLGIDVDEIAARERDEVQNGATRGFDEKHSRSHEHSSTRSANEKVEDGKTSILPPPPFNRKTTTELGLPFVSTLPALPVSDDTDIGGPSIHQLHDSETINTLAPHLQFATSSMKRPFVTEDCMRDPLNTDFYQNIWHAVAENNTVLFRSVFKCMPDNEVKDWKQYKEYTNYSEKFAQVYGSGQSKAQQDEKPKGASITGPPGAGTILTKPVQGLAKVVDATGLGSKTQNADQDSSASTVREKDGAMGVLKEKSADHPQNLQVEKAISRPQSRQTTSGNSLDEKAALQNGTSNGSSEKLNVSSTNGTSDVQRNLSVSTTDNRRRRRTTVSKHRGPNANEDLVSLEDGEKLMNMVQGQLVVFPYDWLVKEEQGGNWLYSIDALAPLEIYD